jgi:selenocysteine lyase/cysteine desulfurase
MAHAAGALAFVDAVHYAPHALVDVAAIDCDFLACSAYKFYGPHVGVLYGRRALLEGLDVPKLDPAPDTAPDRLETGTQNHEGIVHLRGQQLFTRLWDGLGAIRGVTRYGPPPSAPRTPTISFAVDGHDPGDVAASLAERAVFVSHGDFYATTVIERLARGPGGLVRAGCACYTTAAEIDRLVDGVARLATA